MGGISGPTSVDLNGDGIPDLNLFANAGGGQFGWAGAATVTAGPGGMVGGVLLLGPTLSGPLHQGNTVGPQLTFNAFGPYADAAYSITHPDQNRNVSAGNGLYGIEIHALDGTHFAWADLGAGVSGYIIPFMGGTASAGAVVGPWAYESTPNTPIVVGVPQPTSNSLLALVACAMIVRGRRTSRWV